MIRLGDDPGLWQAFFAWPLGGVWSNLVANVIWGLPALLIVIWRLEKSGKLKEYETRVEEEYEHLDKEHFHDMLPDIGGHRDQPGLDQEQLLRERGVRPGTDERGTDPGEGLEEPR